MNNQNSISKIQLLFLLIGIVAFSIILPLKDIVKINNDLYTVKSYSFLRTKTYTYNVNTTDLYIWGPRRGRYNVLFKDRHTDEHLGHHLESVDNYDIIDDINNGKTVKHLNIFEFFLLCILYFSAWMAFLEKYYQKPSNAPLPVNAPPLIWYTVQIGLIKYDEKTKKISLKISTCMQLILYILFFLRFLYILII